MTRRPFSPSLQSQARPRTGETVSSSPSCSGRLGSARRQVHRSDPRLPSAGVGLAHRAVLPPQGPRYNQPLPEPRWLPSGVQAVSSTPCQHRHVPSSRRRYGVAAPSRGADGALPQHWTLVPWSPGRRRRPRSAVVEPLAEIPTRLWLPSERDRQTGRRQGPVAHRQPGHPGAAGATRPLGSQPRWPALGVGGRRRCSPRASALACSPSIRSALPNEGRGGNTGAASGRCSFSFLLEFIEGGGVHSFYAPETWQAESL